jgi:hypothetical protein
MGGTSTVSGRGDISVTSLGNITIRAITTNSSATGIIRLSSQQSITTVGALTFANLTSLSRPEIFFVTSSNILVNSYAVLANTTYFQTNYGATYPSGLDIPLGGDVWIDLQAWSPVLTGT